jgi:SNF2 family DNA or RNA helicase
LKYKPHAYQERAIKWVLGNPAAGLLLDVGMGKTSIALTAIKTLLEADVIDSVLIIAPLHVCHRVWPNEIEKWDLFKDSLSYTVLHGDDKEERLKDIVDIYIINPEGLKWLEEQRGWQWPEMLIIDESSRFKNTKTVRFKVIKPHLPEFSRRLILTGTPIPNGLMDLFGQLYILDLGERLGKFITHYRNKYFVPSGFMGYKWNVLPESESIIHDKIGDICMRLESADYLEMPDIIYTDIELELPPDARRTYDKLEKEFFVQLEGHDVIAFNAAAMSTKLRQVGNGAVYSLTRAEEGGSKYEYVNVHDEKMDALESLVEEIGQPVIIAYEFKHDLARLLEKYPNAGVIGKGASKKKVAAALNKWDKGELPILIVYPGSAGHGLNLQFGGHHLIWFGLTWNLEYYEQLNGRLFRQGQKNTVMIYHLVVKDSLDQAVLRALAGKTKTQKALLDAVKKWRKKNRG